MRRQKRSLITVKPWTGQSISQSDQSQLIWVRSVGHWFSYSCSKDALTPTVKLNGLAMKRGEMAIYKILDRKPMYNNQQYNSQVLSDPMKMKLFASFPTICPSCTRIIIRQSGVVLAFRSCSLSSYKSAKRSTHQRVEHDNRRSTRPHLPVRSLLSD